MAVGAVDAFDDVPVLAFEVANAFVFLAELFVGCVAVGADFIFAAGFGSRVGFRFGVLAFRLGPASFVCERRAGMADIPRVCVGGGLGCGVCADCSFRKVHEDPLRRRAADSANETFRCPAAKFIVLPCGGAVDHDRDALASDRVRLVVLVKGVFG